MSVGFQYDNYGTGSSENGIFDAANNGGTVPIAFSVNLTDSIAFNGGNVGIGTNTPLYGLDIQKDTYALNVEGTSPSGGNAFRMVIDQTTGRTNGAVAVIGIEGDATNINTAGLQISMNPLIGGTSPALRVIGTPDANYGALFTLKGGTAFNSDLGGTDIFNYASNVGSLSVGFLGTSIHKLFVYNQNALANVAAFADSTNTKYFTISDAGVASYTGAGVQMGIGTTTPNATLDVIGDISSTEGYDLANNLFIHSTRNGNRSDTASGNVFLGQSTALSVSTGINNVGIGLGTMSALSSGFANIAIGSLSLDSNTVGRDNVSIGIGSFGSLFNAAVGGCSFNTGIGQSAFANTVIAGGVVGIGIQTGTNITNGTDLTLLGRNTGATTAGTYSDSVAIGAYAQFNGNNQCVFGAQTSGSTLDNFYFGAGIEQTTINPLKISFNVTNISAGQTDTASDYNWEFNGSRGTGTGAGGDIYFQTAPAGTTGTAQNALVEALRIGQDSIVSNPTSDFETKNSSKGFVVLDRTNGNRYRIYTDNGVLNTELVP